MWPSAKAQTPARWSASRPSTSIPAPPGSQRSEQVSPTDVRMFEVWRTESLDSFFFSPDNQQVDAIHVTQLERDTVLVCLDREYLLSRSTSVFSAFLMFSPPPAENLKIVNLQGRLKSNKKLASELSFDFCIESVGELSNRTDMCRCSGTF